VLSQGSCFNGPLPMADRSNSTFPGLRDPIGLCATCRHARVVPSSRGSTFYLCRLAESNPRFSKYPRLPMLRCAGYESAENPEATMGAVILAAGQSRRMGRNKMLLPFATSTVLETVVTEVAACDQVHDLVVVTGHQADQIAALLGSHPLRCIFNPAYAQADMLVSIQVGLRALSTETTAALIVLGDQPRLQRQVIQRVVEAQQPNAIIIPSYQMKRGHPILIDRALWPEVLALPETATLRDFIHAHEAQIRYVVVETDSVLKDMDTPEDYAKMISHES
jgi:molybdenum cofactor cytidylyltransferase